MLFHYILVFNLGVVGSIRSVQYGMNRIVWTAEAREDLPSETNSYQGTVRRINIIYHARRMLLHTQ
jgi:hypothetical protein